MNTPEDIVEFFPEEEVSSSSIITAPVKEEASVSPSVTVPVQTMTTPDKPEAPIMGGLRNFGTHYDAWTGKKPIIDWTGLGKAKPEVNNPNQLRSYTVKAQSVLVACRNGL